jgi:hypothetical protein
MPEKFPYNKIEDSPEVPQKAETKADSSKVEEFFDKESEILGAYGMKGDITLERGDSGWAFDFKNRKLIYDPNFFIERGYNMQETLFATTHELMAHYGELLRDPDIVLKEVNRYCSKEHLYLLHNIFEDVLGNRRIVGEMPFLEETREKLYKEKLFPQTDYRENASHVQFAYGFIREMMVPNESVELSEKARQALEKLRAFGEDKIDILDLVTTPTIEPKDRFQIMRNIVEPIYLELYQEDLKKEKNKKGGKKDSEKGEGSPKEGTPQEDKSGGQKGKGEAGKGKKHWWQKGKGEGKEEPKPSQEPGKPSEGAGGESKKSDAEAKKRFQKEYKAYTDSNPQPLKPEDVKKLKKTLETMIGKRGGTPSLDRKIIEQWAKEHGVSAEDVLEYRKEYEEVAPLVRELREVFKKIVSRRLRERWKMSPQLETEGEALDEETLAESYVESKAGGKPAAFREIIRSKKEEIGYGSLDMTLINDLSGSMNEGMKLPMDRKSKLLFLESLADFQKEIKEAEYESGVSLGLEVKTETRAFGDFGDAELKPLSPELSEKDRIAIWKKLHKGDGGTPDYLSLESVEKSINEDYAKELKEKRKRRVVVVLSDGESQDSGRVQRALDNLRKKGVIVSAFGMTSSGQAVKETYKPDAEVIEDIRQLPKAMQNIILKYVSDL